MIRYPDAPTSFQSIEGAFPEWLLVTPRAEERLVDMLENVFDAIPDSRLEGIGVLCSVNDNV